MRITVLGCGYVGLVTAACFAEKGHTVTCIDIDEKKVEALQNGIVPIYEPGLEELTLRNTAQGRLHFTTNLAKTMEETLACIIAVPTPSTPQGACDLSFVLEAAKAIALNMTKYCLIITKSTVPVGTAQLIQSTIQAHLTSDIPFDVVSNPEFLKEGGAISDCLYPDRAILGVSTQTATELMCEIYSPFNLPPDCILTMDPPSAEMTKYAANAMLATRISFMNELAELCEKLGANIHAVREGIGSDPRIGPHFLQAGAGFGGSCFPKDIKALLAMAESIHSDAPLLTATHTVNEKQKHLLFQKLAAYFPTLPNQTIAIWGLSFKPNTDDMREASSLTLIDSLLKAGAILRLYDPIAMPNAKRLLSHPNITWCQSPLDASSGSHATVLVTEWKQFKDVDFDEILKQMKGCAFFDGRNLLSMETMREKGFDYFGIGVPEGKVLSPLT